MLKVNNITKSFHNNQVISNFSFNIDSGEVVTLIGKSGTGKTTLMRMINNLEKADSGSIAIEDTYLCNCVNNKAKYANSNLRREYQNKIGMVFQDYALFNNLNVLDNLLEAPLAQKIASKEELIEKAKKLLIDIDLIEKIDAKIDTLSGGQKQRVAIARALMLNPLFLCFDEPTSSLDNESIKNVIKLIKKLSNKGTGILIVTHNIEFAKKVSTRMIDSSEFILQ